MSAGLDLAEARPGLGQTLTGTGPVAVRLGPVDKSTKKSPMAGRYEGLSDRHRTGIGQLCVGFDSDELPITKSSEEYNSALNSSDAPTRSVFYPPMSAEYLWVTLRFSNILDRLSIGNTSFL